MGTHWRSTLQGPYFSPLQNRIWCLTTTTYVHKRSLDRESNELDVESALGYKAIKMKIFPHLPSLLPRPT